MSAAVAEVKNECFFIFLHESVSITVKNRAFKFSETQKLREFGQRFFHGALEQVSQPPTVKEELRVDFINTVLTPGENILLFQATASAAVTEKGLEGTMQDKRCYRIKKIMEIITFSLDF